VAVIAWYVDLQLPMQSVSITADVVSSIPDYYLLLLLLLLLLYNIYIAHYITITLSASHYKTIKIIQDTN
jgi:hypothetical protein